LKVRTEFVAGLLQLDVYTLREDWALAVAQENHWRLLADSLGLPPSKWLDSKGERMYAAVVALSTRFDLGHPVREDDAVKVETELTAIRKPHALSATRFTVGGTVRAEATLLTSFVKRTEPGSNKKFSRVRELWAAKDMNGEVVDGWIDEHHAMKQLPHVGEVVQRYEINRIIDFNVADFLFFKNFVRIAKAAEWRENRGRPPVLNSDRRCFFYGNVEDGEVVDTRVLRADDSLLTTHHRSDGKCIFVSKAIRECFDIRAIM
jgi:probable biosynthetic protein (TIGR04098 family)